MPSRVSNEVQVSTDCWRRLKSPLFILNSIQTKATLEREREIQFFYPTFFRCFFSMASMVRLYHSFLDHEWPRWRSMTRSTDSFRSRNARKKIISVLYIYIIRWQVIVQIVNRLYFLLLLPKIQRLETMANDFIVKFNRRLIHVGPWRFFFFFIYSYLLRKKPVQYQSCFVFLQAQHKSLQYEVKMLVIRHLTLHHQIQFETRRFSFLAI